MTPRSSNMNAEETHRSRQRRREQRFASTFPGLIRILFPERSFNPVSLAARVLNLSSGGALVELHDGHLRGEDSENLRGTFCELRIAAGLRVALYGRIARAEKTDGKLLLGIMYHRSHPELVGDLIHGETIDIEPDALLPLPVLEPYSPMVEEETVSISGEAPDSEEVVVENADGRATSIAVRDGIFRITIKLEAEGPQQFRVFSRRGQLRSAPQTLEFIHVPVNSARLHLQIEEGQDASGRYEIACEYIGTAEALERIITATREATKGSDQIKLALRARSTEPFPDGLAEKIRRDIEKDD